MAHFKGKNHIRPGFDYWFSFIGQGKYFNPYVNDNGQEYQINGYMTDILTEKAINWLKNVRETNKPFSLNIWHKAVHQHIYLLKGMKNYFLRMNFLPHHLTHIKKHFMENQNGKEKEPLVLIGKIIYLFQNSYPKLNGQ